MLVDDGTWVSKECIKIYKECEGNQPELERRLAILTADHLLPTIRRLVEPEPPKLVKAYRLKNQEDRMRFDKDVPDWRQTPEVQDWQNEVNRVRTENESNVHWLKEWMKADVGDERREKLRQKLREFVGLNDEEAEQVRAVQEQFGGTVHKTNFAKPKDIIWE